MLVRTNAQTAGPGAGAGRGRACRSRCVVRSGSSTAPRCARRSGCCGPPPGRPSAPDEPAAEVRADPGQHGLTRSRPAAAAPRASAGSRSRRWRSSPPTSSLPIRRPGWPAWSAELGGSQRDRARAGHGRGHAWLAARGEGSGVGGRLPARPDRRHGADRLRADRRGDRGGAPAALCRHHQGPRAALPVLGAGPGSGRAPDPQAVQVPRRPDRQPGGARQRARRTRPPDRLGGEHESGRGEPARTRTTRSSAGSGNGGWRQRKSRACPAYVVFSDATLQAIAAARPATRGELAGIPGVGAVKLDRYGAAVLELCAAPPMSQGSQAAP